MSDERLLMVLRGRGPGVGKWSIPGGRVEPGETPEQAVVREVMEETGVRGECEALMGSVERLGPGHHFVILDYRMRLLADGDPVAGDDAADVAWVPLAEVAHLSMVDGLASFLADHGVIAGP
ncbi:MAG: NUDIX domain-containing protein [Actinomycetota bacterium]|nr:NUDIX domain-containing protein [Actinomycetota bacterium]